MGRNRSNFDSTPYTIAWTDIFTTYLKKQLGDIVLPRAATSQSTAIKSVFKSVLAEPESRQKWINKFSYT
jgi:mediator of RNA polymerase II transcription subunit 12, fungi type